MRHCGLGEGSELAGELLEEGVRGWALHRYARRSIPEPTIPFPDFLQPSPISRLRTFDLGPRHYEIYDQMKAPPLPDPQSPKRLVNLVNTVP